MNVGVLSFLHQSACGNERHEFFFIINCSINVCVLSALPMTVEVEAVVCRNGPGVAA